MAPILLNNITFYENRNTDQNGELSIWVMLQGIYAKNKLILSICSFVIQYVFGAQSVTYLLFGILKYKSQVREVFLTYK